MLKGSIVAIVTPMHPNGSVDFKALHDLIEWHIQSGTDGIVIAGTTGEAVTLDDSEQYEIISSVVSQVNKRIPVIAGTGSNCTRHTIELTQAAKKAGVDACLIVTPYYNRPTQHGLYEHYKVIAETVAIPIILYNVPPRTACDLLPETIAKLAKINNIIGVKEASGKLDRVQEITKSCGPEFKIFSGEDETALDLMLQGGHGVISVTANVAPQKMHNMCKAALSGDADLAKKINQELMPLHKKLFVEANPIPTKWALYEMGLIPAGIRLPLTLLSEKFHAEVKNAMQAAGIEKQKQQVY